MSRGLLIALSGMDGAGKTSAAKEIARRLADRGVPARVEWQRLGEQRDVLARLARPFKHLLRPRSTVADPLASGRPERVVAGAPREHQRRGPVAWAWTLVVAAVVVRHYRRTARNAQAGTVVVCDRWACDSLVDLEVRYGRHRAAAWLLRSMVPHPDLAILLEIDAATSLRRKPGDQAEPILARMERLYDAAADSLGLTRLDARRPPEQVLADLDARVARLPGARSAGAGEALPA
jgi:thymidylate kinase